MPPTPPVFQQTFFPNLRLGLGAFVPFPITQSVGSLHLYSLHTRFIGQDGVYQGRVSVSSGQTAVGAALPLGEMIRDVEVSRWG
jgi:hypothetical protein